ncbi:glycosyltransferase [Microbacterium sp. CnD16-F]|uniref:glycosyltransferase n=1 Tax=Microbacterium sp. CnD16-F TaxID=2954493 RepID=UPI00209681B5|nr:glycosyltransferase [Microbacterium sp. CnD16-F]MCO7203133.1 glycosyltransferase [Microbacterium sp. CnD16-F]
MKDKRRAVLVLIAGLLVAMASLVAFAAPAWLTFIAVVLQIALVLVVVDTRRALSLRILAAAKNFETRLNRRLGSPRGVPSRKSARAKAPDRPAPDTREADVKKIRASLVFDQEWYESEVAGQFRSLDDAIKHYLNRGRKAGFSPHPLFQPAWMMRGTWSKVEKDPLLSYLENEDGLWAKSTSPLFDPAHLRDDVVDAEYGPLTGFLRDAGSDSPLPYGSSGSLRSGITLDDVRSFLRSHVSGWREREHVLAPTRGSRVAPPETDALEEAREALRARGEDLPLVSIILPTWNRSGQLRAAMQSVFDQTYPRWELLIADDGSIDDTLQVVNAVAATDSRVIPLELPHRGVSAARNAALARAKGEYIAFLDSDKQWETDFLFSMVAHLELSGGQAAYSCVEVSLNGASLFRTTPATPESLLVANSIDQTAIVARRELIMSVGGFDEDLRRAVDYDLILSLVGAAELDQVPYVGVKYSEDDQDPNRISEAESIAWNFYVRDRRRWADASLPECEPGLVSIVVDGVRTFDEARATLDDLKQHVGAADAEILLLPTSHAWPVLQSVLLAEFSVMNVRVMPAVGVNDRPALRLNHALRAVRGEYVYVTNAQTAHMDGQIVELIDRLHQTDAAVVHPVVLDRRRLIQDAGVVYAPNGRDPIGLLAGLPADWATGVSAHVSVPGATVPFLMRTTTMRHINGFNTKLRQLWADIDMSQRAAAAEAKPVIVDLGNAVRAREPSLFTPKPESKHDVLMFHDLWDEAPSGSTEAAATLGVIPAFEGFSSLSIPLEPSRWSRARWQLPSEQPALVVGDRPQSPLRWSIKMAAPADERSLVWGDFHFANSLARALRELGERVSVDYGPNIDRETANSDQVVVNLRGLRTAPLPAGATSVIWVISHPDEVTPQELASYDLRYAASTSWGGRMMDQWGIQVDTLLQCTDPDLFFIQDDSVPAVADKLLMVGNSRKQYRPAACETANAGLPVVIYGNGWEGFVDGSNIAGTYVPNDELRRFYRSAQWSLNDHWADMRELGFVSNRVFDVLASGGRLLTDRVDGLDDLFPAAVLPRGVATFGSPVELLAIAETGPSKYYNEATLRAVSDYVREQHSFLARARVLQEDVRRHRTANY